MRNKGNNKVATLCLLLSLIILGASSAWAAQSRPPSIECAPGEEAKITFFRTTAQLEPVGGMTASACTGGSASDSWGVQSQFYRVSCRPETTCD